MLPELFEEVGVTKLSYNLITIQYQHKTEKTIYFSSKQKININFKININGISYIILYIVLVC